MRGLSGSGKTTIAQEIHNKYENSVVCCADHYFMKDGEYVNLYHYLKYLIIYYISTDNWGLKVPNLYYA